MGEVWYHNFTGSGWLTIAGIQSGVNQPLACKGSRSFFVSKISFRISSRLALADGLRFLIVILAAAVCAGESLPMWLMIMWGIVFNLRVLRWEIVRSSIKLS